MSDLKVWTEKTYNAPVIDGGVCIESTEVTPSDQNFYRG